MTTELKGKSVTAPAVLLVEFPDKLRLELQDPVGGILILLVLNGDRFWLYQHDRPEILTGPLRRLPAHLFPSVSVRDLVRVFLARPDEARLRRAKLSEGKAEFQEKERKETVHWKERLAEPTEWWESETGQGSASALYEDYEFKSGLRYPTKIHLVGIGADRQEREVMLAWKDWDPSVPKEKKLFQIPQQETFERKIKELR